MLPTLWTQRKNNKSSLHHPASQKRVFLSKVNKLKFKDTDLILVDDYFNTQPFLEKLKTKYKDRVFVVTAGEGLKSLDALSSLLSQLQTKDIHNIERFVAIGGGSVGDFTGFLASIYKRGRPWVFVPSTWLSIIDSSIGGKSALNFGEIKNHIGSFHAAAEVFAVQGLVSSQEPQEAWGEIVKTTMLAWPKVWSQKFLAESFEEQADFKNWVWDWIKTLQKEKIKWVKKDPFEQKSQRQVLNLGHSFGHIIEKHFNLSHSKAIEYGLLFILKWSFEEKHITENTYNDFLKLLSLHHPIEVSDIQIEKNHCEALLMADKKNKGSKILMVFPSEKGPRLIWKTHSEFMNQCQYQGWIKA